MKVINYGSLNIDLVYRVHEFVRPGETISAMDFSRFVGGKGLNQSIALARAGAPVMHAGAVGEDGDFLLDTLKQSNVDCMYVEKLAGVASGHAVIQVNDHGENCIVLFGGANHAIDEAHAEAVLSHAEPGDILLLQNEISCIPHIMRTANRLGMRIFFNPAPMTSQVLAYPLDLVDTLIVNETEMESLGNHVPEKANILKTLGANGAEYNGMKVPAEKVANVVDTTAAGDTFIGYFIAELVAGLDVRTAMETATRASAWCIQRMGASPSIPSRKDIQKN